MAEFHKYVRTPHIRGSRFQHGDEDLEAVSFDELKGKHLVIEEKVDGANAGISFSPKGELLLQSRGHYLRGGPREKHFNVLKQWSSCHKERFFQALGTRYVMYGEYLYAKHTYFYDALPHYFMEFDVLDTHENVFLGTDSRSLLLMGLGIVPVLVLGQGRFDSVDDIRKFIGRSNFITKNRRDNLITAAQQAGVEPDVAVKHTDMSSDMEGLYIKWEEDGLVKGRYKFVRETFTNSIMDQEDHWLNRPIIENALLPGAFDRMFE